MTKPKSSALSIVVPSVFIMYLVNVSQFLNATWVAWYLVTVILSNHKD